jgi:hypothetical protein
MSALTHAGQPAPAASLSRERGGARLADLVWLTWRQHRTVVIAGLVIAAAVTGSMLYVAARITAISQECGNAACPDGSAQAALLGGSFGLATLSTYLTLAVLLLPLLAGMFLGTPLLAREHEQRTLISYSYLETPGDSYERASVRNGPWRYTRYKIYVFLLTTDGIRQIVYDLGTRHGDIQQRERRSYRYDAISSVEASLPKDGSRQTFELHLVDGQKINFRLAEPITDWDPEKSDADVLSSATEDATGLRNTLRILEGVAADGKGWVAREAL